MTLATVATVDMTSGVPLNDANYIWNQPGATVTTWVFLENKK